jgi:hypothetical protein
MASAIRSRSIPWLLSALLLLFLLHQTAQLEENAISSYIGNDYQYLSELLALPPSAERQRQSQRLTMIQLMKIQTPTCHDNDILHLSLFQSLSQYHENQNQNQTSQQQSRIPSVIHQADFDFTCHGGHVDGIDNNNIIDDQQAFIDIILQWKNITKMHYYFHTRPQMEAFVYQDWPEFPHLISIAMNCIPQRQGFVDLWKALILWEFGGGVVDYDWIPKPHNDNNNHHNTIEDLIQPHDQAILFMDVRTTTAEPHDRYTSILFVEPKHPLAYYLVLGILSRLSHQRHLDSMRHPADGAFVSGSSVLDLSFVYFTTVDTADADFRMRHHAKHNRKFPPELREYHGRYNRTLRLVNAMDHVDPSDATNMTKTRTITTRLMQNYYYNDWRGYDETYPLFNNHDNNDDDDDDDDDYDDYDYGQQQPQQQKATCMQRRLDYFVKSMPHLDVDES